MVRHKGAHSISILDKVMIAHVEDLWNSRAELYHPKKHTTLPIFYRSFLEVIEAVHNNFTFTLASASQTEYWTYLRRYHKSWRKSTPQSRRQMWRKFTSAINLYHSISSEGMQDPLTFHIIKGKPCLYLGTRRLVILHVLGIKTAEIIMIDKEGG